MSITPKPFTESLKLVKRIFKGRPNILSAEDLAQEIDAINTAYTRLSLVAGMVRNNWSINLKLSQDTIAGTQNNYATEINILKTDNAQPAVIYYKGVRFELPTGDQVNYSGNFTKTAPLYPVGYVCLIAKKHTITFSESSTIAGITSSEAPEALPSSDAVVYKDERIVYTDDVTTITLNSEEEFVGIIATVEPRDVSDFSITAATVANPAQITLQKKFDRTVRYNALLGDEIVKTFPFQYGDDLLEELGYSAQVGSTQNFDANNGNSDMWATFRDYIIRKFRYIKMSHKWFKFNIDAVNAAITDLKNQVANLTGNVGNATNQVRPPKGAIIMYEGTFEAFDPDGKGKTGTDFVGWAVCNGLNGTPDLRGRFIVGAIQNIPSVGVEDLANEVNPTSPDFLGYAKNYTMTDTGGEPGHKLTEEELPDHDHSNGSHDRLLSHTGEGTGISFDAGDQPDLRTDAVIKAVGENKLHNNLPPYYALAYLKRIA